MKKNKLLKYSLFSVSMLSSSIIIATSFQNSQNIRSSFFNDQQQKNDQLEMSKNIGFPIQTILKTGHDAERINLFFFAEGYNKTQEQLFFNDIKEHIYKALNYTYKEFSSLFNIYAVFSHIDNNGKSFFGVSNATRGQMYNIQPQGVNKLKEIINIVENSFLDKGGKIADISITNLKSGRSVAVFLLDAKPYNKKYNITIRHDLWNKYVFCHETGHSLIGLADEYPGGGNFDSLANISSINDPTKIKWKEFLGFKNIGIITLQNGIYKPSNSCIMNDPYTKYEFCEVCNYHVFLRLNEFKTKDIYIAKPSISLEHKYDEAYKELNFADSSTGDVSLSETLNKKIDFSSVVHNFRKNSRKIKLRMRIEDSSKTIKKEWNQEFNIQPNELKKITILTEEITSEFAKNKYKIYGDVIDAETKEVLESRKSKFERDNDYKQITINYKLFENDTTTSTNIYSSLVNIPFKVATNSNYTFVPPTIKGFKYKQAQGDLSFKVDSDKEITLYYEKLKSKKFKVQLKDEDGYIVETKEEAIYENEVFKPSFYDFLLISDFSSIHYKKSIPESDKIWKYDEIKDNEIVLFYNIVEDRKSMIDARDVYLDFGSTWDFNQYATLYTYQWYSMPKNSGKLIASGDSVDTNKPGVYYVTFLVNSTDNKRQKTIRVFVKNQNGSLPSINNDLNTQLKDEKIRIENTLFYPKKWQYKSDEIKKITNKNLFNDYIWGLKQKNDFQYQVTSLNIANNKIQFKLQISKNGSSIETKEIETIYKLNDNLIPTNEELKKEIKEEKARIDALNLEFRKSSYTREEINQLNEKNILSELKNLTTKQGFTYEFMDVQSFNWRTWVEFDIKISKQHLFEKSKHFVVYFVLSTDPIQPPSVQIKTEQDRINKLELELKKTVYSQEEIDQITKFTLFNYLNNWDPKCDFSYEISYLNIMSNRISFIIKIKDLKTNETIESNSFNFSYQLIPSDIDSTLKELENEKSRIDNLLLKLKKENYTQEEINNLNELTLIKELSEWYPNSNFKYCVREFKKEANKITFKIEINKNNQSVTTKYFSLNYQLENDSHIILDPDKSKGDKNNNKNKEIIKNKNNNNLTTILLSTLIPISIIAIATIGIVYLKKKI